MSFNCSTRLLRAFTYAKNQPNSQPRFGHVTYVQVPSCWYRHLPPHPPRLCPMFLLRFFNVSWTYVVAGGRRESGHSDQCVSLISLLNLNWIRIFTQIRTTLLYVPYVPYMYACAEDRRLPFSRKTCFSLSSLALKILFSFRACCLYGLKIKCLFERRVWIFSPRTSLIDKVQKVHDENSSTKFMKLVPCH